MKRHIAALAACLGAFIVGVLPAQAGTPNTTAAGAVSYEVGAGWVTDGVDEGNQNRWFAFTELAGRSYCVEAALGPATYFPLDPNLTLYSDSAGNVVYLSNTDGAAEPSQYRGSRVCYQSPLALGATMVRLLKVNVPITAGSGDSGFVRTRIVDTTLIFPVFWIKNDSTGASKYGVTLSLSNTTTTDINVTVYVPGYGAVATYNASSGSNARLKAPNQATGTGKLVTRDVKAPSGVVSWDRSGAVYLAHDGPPGSVEAWADTNDPAGGTGTIRVYANSR
jgi:hypothetical protein